MLKKLLIHNVALIKHLEVDLSTQLNILSGETGAGKSIIVDGLILLLGGRYDKSILRYGEEKGFVEGVFETNESAKQLMDELGIEADDTLIVNRKFTIEGKNEIKLNGRAATISMLRALMSVLVDIYGQNEYQSLSKQSEHMKILNYFVRKETAVLSSQVNELYNEHQKIKRELAQIGSSIERERQIDMLKYQITEIERANVQEGEQGELSQKRKLFMSAEMLLDELNCVKENLLTHENGSAWELCVAAQKSLSRISTFSKGYEELYERIMAVSIELDDIAETVSGLIDGLDFNPVELERIELRLELLSSLKRKYGNFNQMQSFYLNAKQQLRKLQNSDEDYELLIKKRTSCANKLYNLSVELSNVRRAGAIRFEKLIENELADLGMEGAKFRIVFSDLPAFDDAMSSFTALGLDNVEFYLSANKGQPVQPLIKIISGGELSRFMLALKVVSSRLDDIPTMIFDEIDTGISGKVGQEVAKKLALLSRTHQVLCVTHLPQIASMADNHYYISKSNNEESTQTDIVLLDSNEIIEEISRLSGAKDISEQSSLNAYAMKQWSDNFKMMMNKHE